ncbi:DUF3833 family protein [Halodesulfovibrio spirochaetisodalis]|uniref:DUF3833 family protein n=1 Tax=Halodesulfovibrio spirochaetisodalis TaxID=1560234 RepID=UPI00082DB541|nr:DUF3833 family protein [Halodesulfovibrio spirochaetisodalis]
MSTFFDGRSNITAQSNAAGGEPFALEEFFAGELAAHGVMLGRNGRVLRSFTAVMHGSWQQNTNGMQGHLTENFVFDNGEKMQRFWEFVGTGDKQFEGTAADVQGVAELVWYGNALRMDYTLVVPFKGRTLAVQVEDWLWRMNSEVVVNKSIMRKWRFRVGEIITTIIRKDE